MRVIWLASSSLKLKCSTVLWVDLHLWWQLRSVSHDLYVRYIQLITYLLHFLFSLFYIYWRFIQCSQEHVTVTLPWTRLIQSLPAHSPSLRFIWMFSSHLCLGLPGESFPFWFSGNIFCAFLISALHAAWSLWYVRWRVQIIKLLLMQFSPTFCYFSLA
jgi:hypothetical protein